MNLNIVLLGSAFGGVRREKEMEERAMDFKGWVGLIWAVHALVLPLIIFGPLLSWLNRNDKDYDPR